MFQNPEIALEDLPMTEGLEWLALDPAYRQLRVLESGIFVSVAAIALILVGTLANIPIVPGLALGSIWLFISGLLLTWPFLSLPRRGYVLRDKDILFRKGVVWRSVTAVPFNRIQHVETSNTPFDRKFELATLQLFTAGGSSGDLKIDGLNKHTSEQLRVYILDKAGASIESN